MGTLSATFARLRSRNEKALVLFVTAGDPDIAQLPAILDALAEGGADVIEVGVPFSDPIADGPVIQASSQRALDRGTTLGDVLSAIKGFEKTPVVLMGYYNTLLRVGLSEAAKRLAGAGVSGTIVSDLTPEEAGEWLAASKVNNLDNVFLAAPTSTDARLDLICSLSSGLVYALSRTGVTGAASQAADASGLVARIKSRTSLPVCVGFGISQAEQLRAVCAFADGAVVGSWLVDWLAANWNEGKGRSELVALVRRLKEATL